MEDIISTVDDSFKIQISEIEILGGKGGSLVGKLQLFANNRCMNPNVDLEVINHLPVGDLIYLLEDIDRYLPIVGNDLFNQGNEYIKNNLIFPLCQSIYEKMSENFDYNLNEISAFFPSTGPFDSIYGVMLRSPNEKQIRLVWTNNLDPHYEVESEIIDFNVFISTIVLILFRIKSFCEHNSLNNQHKDQIEMIYKSWAK